MNVCEQCGEELPDWLIAELDESDAMIRFCTEDCELDWLAERTQEELAEARRQQ